MSGSTSALPNAPTSVVDSAGRTIKFSRLSILQELDLMEAAGANSANGRWMMMATLACCVLSINDIPSPAPVNREKIRQIVQMVGSHGIAAVVKALSEDDAEIEGKAETVGLGETAGN